MRRHSCFAGVQLLGAAKFLPICTVVYSKTPLPDGLVAGFAVVLIKSSEINLFADQLFFALQVDRANVLESRAYRKFQTFKLDAA